MASSAPAASAAAARPLLALTRAESTRIGSGCELMISSMAVSPSMPGSSRSMITRSGLMLGRAAMAALAVAQTAATVISPP